MQWIYQLIVLYLSVNLIVYLFREKRTRWQISAALVLVMFLLRLFLIK
jgi:hypothetical protein